MKHSNKLLYIKRSNISPHIDNNEIGRYFLTLAYHLFFWTETTFAFLHSYFCHIYFYRIEQKAYLIIEKLNQLKNLNTCFGPDLFFF